MTDYTPCHRASDRYDLQSAAIEAGDLWLDEPMEEFEWDEAIDPAVDEDWLADLSGRAQAYDQSLSEARSDDVPFPELIEAAIQVMQAAQEAGIEF